MKNNYKLYFKFSMNEFALRGSIIETWNFVFLFMFLIKNKWFENNFFINPNSIGVN